MLHGFAILRRRILPLLAPLLLGVMSCTSSQPAESETPPTHPTEQDDRGEQTLGADEMTTVEKAPQVAEQT